jgi:hypothetical protein
MPRFAGSFIICVLALANNQANAQAGAMPPPASQQETVKHPASSNEQPASAPSGASANISLNGVHRGPESEKIVL